MIDKNVFTDRVRITIKSGDGGDGMNSFKSFKGKPACGPDGGGSTAGSDGGSGAVSGSSGASGTMTVCTAPHWRQRKWISSPGSALKLYF